MSKKRPQGSSAAVWRMPSWRKPPQRQRQRQRILFLLATALLFLAVSQTLEQLLRLQVQPLADGGEVDDAPSSWTLSLDLHNTATNSKRNDDDDDNDDKDDSQEQNIIPGPHPIHIYWIHDATTTTSSKLEQGHLMDRFLRTLTIGPNQTTSIHQQGLATKIRRWTTQEVQRMLSGQNSTDDNTKLALPRLLLHNNVTLQEKVSKRRPKGPNYIQSFDEAANFMTHLTIIHRALQEGHEQVLILQDDTILSQDFFNHWQDYASYAPPHWTLLQWTTTNLATIEQSFPLPEPWMSWLPDLWGTHAYSVTQKGLQGIRKRMFKETPDGTLQVTLDAKLWGLISANEILFGLDQKAYTSTFPWAPTESLLKSLDAQSSFGKRYGISPPYLPLPNPGNVKSNRKESILILMNIRFATSQRMKMEMDRFLADQEALCSFHPDNRCHWIVQAVFAQPFLKDRFHEMYPDLPSNIHFDFKITDERFNKFGIVAKSLANMTQYDLVFLKDNDQLIAGFPWGTFLKRKGEALVAGPLRQAPDESYERAPIWDKQQHYKFHDAHGWKKPRFAPWSTQLFVEGQAIEVPFLEMYFNVFDGNFAQWFFSQVLTKNFTQQDSCWGPDFLWCSAAADYDSKRTGCVIVPFVSVHEDTRQIFKDGEAFNDRGYQTVDNLRKSNQTFNHWYKITEKYARGVIAWRQLDAITKHCQQKILKSSRAIGFDFRACVKTAMGRKGPVM